MKSIICLTIILIIPGLCRQARGLDTVEVWEPGATNMEVYLGATSLNHQVERRVLGETLIGYGITPELSAYLGTHLEGAADFSRGSNDLFLGLLFNPLDSEHLDLDLLLDLASADSTLELRPGLELNLELDSRGRAGLYTRIWLPVGTPDQAQVPAPAPTLGVDLVLGAHWRPAQGHQLLLEIEDQGIASTGTRTPGFDRIAMGYNLVLVETLELIIQVDQTGETLNPGILTGFVASLP